MYQSRKKDNVTEVTKGKDKTNTTPGMVPLLFT